MKSNRYGLCAISVAMLVIAGSIYWGMRLIRGFDPFPLIEFVDEPGPIAARKMSSWDYSVDPIAVRRASMKSASSIDSYSTWLKFELPHSDAQRIATDLHSRMAAIDPYIQRTKECEQERRSITSIPMRSPASSAPSWWAPPTTSGEASENMLWYPGASGGIAQGCYTIHDDKHETLWVYQYASQGDSHWERGSRPKYGVPSNYDTKQ